AVSTWPAWFAGRPEIISGGLRTRRAYSSSQPPIRDLDVLGGFAHVGHRARDHTRLVELRERGHHAIVIRRLRPALLFGPASFELLRHRLTRQVEARAPAIGSAQSRRASRPTQTPVRSLGSRSTRSLGGRW